MLKVRWSRASRRGYSSSPSSGWGARSTCLFHSQLAKIAVERGCGRFKWSVLDWNTDAIRFYGRLGAKPMDEWTVFRIAGDALVELAKPST